ncbi:Actin depolymerizing factor [Paramicrosporidium saccamoebae]|uniref:Cofilin n=1 Tax=Paramicrosporidium saccamoebae TaxID=1246581 RepID=A0A2H9TNN2_9FUNG|nr:Actin depolymerizing factor [Paramicrosporidium saccamoebae]
MSSGIAVDDECLTVFQDLKLRKKYRYITYRLSDDNRAIIVEKSATEGKYDDFAAELPENDCRYAIFDFEYEKSPNEGKRSKICFIVW